MIVGS